MNRFELDVCLIRHLTCIYEYLTSIYEYLTSIYEYLSSIYEYLTSIYEYLTSIYEYWTSIYEYLTSIYEYLTSIYEYLTSIYEYLTIILCSYKSTSNLHICTCLNLYSCFLWWTRQVLLHVLITSHILILFIVSFFIVVNCNKHANHWTAFCLVYTDVFQFDCETSASMAMFFQICHSLWSSLLAAETHALRQGRAHSITMTIINRMGESITLMIL